ncbi:hypothetical protein ACJJTC_016169 [Scirpophaga incertulas]
MVLIWKTISAGYTPLKRLRGGKKEAVHIILEQRNNDDEYDLTVIPAEFSVFTDVEQSADEDMVSAPLPRDIPGNIKVFRSVKNIIQSVKDDSSNEAPLSDEI